MNNPYLNPRFPTENYLNRELGLLAFNRRVLAQAQDDHVPLLERLRFLCIVSSNLDEFFEVRMAGLKEQVQAHSLVITSDGKTAQEAFRLVSAEPSSTSNSTTSSCRPSPNKVSGFFAAPPGMKPSANGSAIISCAKWCRY